MNKKFLLYVILLLLGCSSSEQSDLENAQVLQIIDNYFEPSEITASAGETILVYNADDESHWIASQSSENAFDDTGDIDTGLIPTLSPGAFVIPENSVSGDIILFYDKIFTDSMVTPNGRVTVN